MGKLIDINALNKNNDYINNNINTRLIDNASKNLAPPFDKIVAAWDSYNSWDLKINVKGGKTVTLSFKISRIEGATIGNNSIYTFRDIKEYDINNNLLNTTDGGIISSFTNGTINIINVLHLNANTSYIVVNFANHNNDGHYNTRKYDVQLEYGDIVTEYTPYYKTNQELDTSLTNVIEETINYNILKLNKDNVNCTNFIWEGNVYRNSSNTISFTFNTDDNGFINEIVVNGNMPNYWTYLVINGLDGCAVDYENYYLSGCPEGGTSYSYSMWLQGGLTHFADDVGSGAYVRIHDTEEKNLTCSVIIGLAPDITYNNLIFRPMLTKSKYVNMPYKPYHENIKQLYEHILVLEARLAALENNSGDDNNNQPLLEDEEVVEKPDVGN